MKPELGDVTPHPPLQGFASSEKVSPVSPLLLPPNHSAPSTPPTAAASVPSVSAASETTAIVAVAASALVPAVPAPCVGTSPAHCALVRGPSVRNPCCLYPGPCRQACDWVGSLALALPTIGRCQDRSAQCSIRASEKSWVIIYRRAGNGTSVW